MEELKTPGIGAYPSVDLFLGSPSSSRSCLSRSNTLVGRSRAEFRVIMADCQIEREGILTDRRQAGPWIYLLKVDWEPSWTRSTMARSHCSSTVIKDFVVTLIKELSVELTSFAKPGFTL